MTIGNAPVALPSIRPHVGGLVRASQCPQRPVSRSYSLPRFPQQLSDSASDPFIHRFRPLFVLRKLEVLAPASKLLAKPLLHGLDTLLSVSRKDFSERILESLLGLRVHGRHDLALDFVKAMTEELHPARDVADGGLLIVDLELHLN